jgi:hypothetical protein
MGDDQSNGGKHTMILIGLISAIWIAVSLLVVGVCLAARFGDQDQQQNTSFARHTAEHVERQLLPIRSPARLVTKVLARDLAA